MKVLLIGLPVLLLSALIMSFAQTERPKGQNTNKSENSCDSYTEFKKKQKAVTPKPATETVKQGTKK